MGKSDALSRRADHGTGSNDSSNIVLLTPGLLAVQALEGLEAVSEEQEIMRDIQKGMRDSEKEEPVAKAARELKNSWAQSVRSAEWSTTDGVLYF